MPVLGAQPPAGCRGCSRPGDDLADVVARARGGAFAQELQAPAPLRAFGAQAEQQRRILLASHFSTFSGAAGLAQGSACETEIWPPLAKLVSAAGLAASMTVTSWPACCEIPGGCRADDAGAQDDHVHGCATRWKTGRCMRLLVSATGGAGKGEPEPVRDRNPHASLRWHYPDQVRRVFLTRGRGGGCRTPSVALWQGRF